MKKTTIFRQALLAAAILMCASCATVQHNVLMGDVISFSEDATTSYTVDGKYQSAPYILHSDEVNFDNKALVQLKTHIKTAPYGVNTSIAYAQDLGLERIKYIRKNYLKNDKSATYYTFILTDGLDNTSVEVARNNKRGNYKNLEAYQAMNQKKIKNVMGLGSEQNKYQVIPILVIGPDLQEFHHEQMREKNDDEFAEFCKGEFMEPYKGASKGFRVEEPIVTYTFDKAKDELIKFFSKASFEFYIPKGYVNQRVKMDMTDANGEHTSFEGTLVKKLGKYYFIDITFGDDDKLTTSLDTAKKKKIGLKAINNDDKKAIVSWFRLEDLRIGTETYKVNRDLVKQSYKKQMKDGKMYYQYNSEYDKNAKPQIDTYFQLIFDTSGSIGENVGKEQEVLFEILNGMTKALTNK